MTQAEIDRDVQIILKNMGLDAPTPPPPQSDKRTTPKLANGVGTSNGGVANGVGVTANGHVTTTTTTAVVEGHPRGPVLQTGL